MHRSLIPVLLILLVVVNVGVYYQLDKLVENTQIWKDIKEQQDKLNEQEDIIPTGQVVKNMPVEVSIDDDPIKGKKDAKVTIIEFSEFQCPFCKRYYDETYNQIIKEYVDTGKAKYVFRDFPLSFHQFAQKASEASECAHEQDKFWEYHDKLFENQQALDISNLKKYAKGLKLDEDKFNDCLDSGKYEDEVKKDMQDGISYGVQGTPAFFINGKLISGAQPYENFKVIIDEELR